MIGMEEIQTGVLRDIVKDRERVGEQAISVDALLDRLQLTPIVDPSELARLRSIETLTRKIVSDPRWELRGPDAGDAEALRRLVLGESE